MLHRGHAAHLFLEDLIVDMLHHMGILPLLPQGPNCGQAPLTSSGATLWTYAARSFLRDHIADMLFYQRGCLRGVHELYGPCVDVEDPLYEVRTRRGRAPEWARRAWACVCERV